MDAVVTRLVARRGDDTSLAGATDDDGLSAKLGSSQQFDRHEERVHVDVQDRAFRHPQTGYGHLST
jgi:hypothetical protein